MKHLKVIISGGGTGGHIFPAIAIAKELEISLNHVDILFVGAKDRMEMQKVPESGYNIEGLWISGLIRSNLFNYSFLSEPNLFNVYSQVNYTEFSVTL